MRISRLGAGMFRVIALCLVFVAAAVIGLVLHLGLRAPRTFATAQVNHILATTFEGTVHVVEVRHLGLAYVSGVEAYALDPEGRRVAWVDEVSASLDWVELVTSLVHGENVMIGVDHLDVPVGEVALDRDPSGELGLARAFASRGPPGPPSERPPIVELRTVTIDHVWAHGDLLGDLAFDADIEDARGSLRSSGAGLSIDVESAALEARGNEGLNPVGVLGGHLEIPAEDEGRLAGGGTFEGRLGEIDVRARGSLRNDDVAFEADVDASPSAMARLAPEAKLRETLHARVDVEGALPVVVGTIRADAGTAELELEGMVVLPSRSEDEVTGFVALDAREIDLGALREGMPRTHLGLDAFAAIAARSASELAALVALETEPGRFDATDIPSVVALAGVTPRAVQANVDVREPGVPLSATVALDRFGPQEEPRVRFSVAATVPDLDRVPRLGPVASGRADLQARGTVLPEREHVDVTASARAWSVRSNGLAARYLELEGEASGPWDAPRLAVSLRGADARAAGYSFPSFRARVAGPRSRFAVEVDARGGAATPSLRLRANASVDPSVQARDVDLRLARDDVELHATVGTIALEEGVVTVNRALIEGLGQPIRADLELGGASVDVHVETGGLELARAMRLAGRHEDLRGYVILDADVVGSSERAKGKIDLIVAGLHVPNVGTGNVALTGTIDERTIRGRAEVDLRDAGKVRGEALPITVGGSLFDIESWKRATGTVDVQGEVHLAKTLERLPKEERPLSYADGVVTLQLRASRDAPKAAPSVRLQVLTKGLVLAGRPEKAAERAPWRIQDVDGAFRFALDAGSNDAKTEVRLRDERGLLATLDVEATLPVDALLRAPSAALDRLAAVPLTSHLVVPRRAIGALPEVLGRIPLDGEIALDATQTGTLRAPTIEATAKGFDLRAAATAPEGCDRPIDLEAAVRFDGKRATLTLVGEAEGRRVAKARVVVRGEEQGGGLAVPADWEAEGDLTLDAFPVGLVRGFAGRAIEGNASGRVELDGLHREGSLESELTLTGLVVDRAALPVTRAALEVAEGRLAGRLRLEQEQGYAELRAEAGVSWGAALVPELDMSRARSLILSFKDLRIAFLGSLLGDVATGVDGRLSGDALLRAPGGGGPAEARGAIEVRDGAISVAQIGERFSDIDAKIAVPRWGTVVIERLSARAPTGRLTGKASVELAGRSIERASAEIRIADGQSIPIAFEGVPLGQVYGTVIAKAAQTNGRLDVNVDVPLLHVELPRTAGRSVQKLAPAEHIRTGVFQGGAFRPLPLDRPKSPSTNGGLALRARVTLGGRKKGEITIRKGTTLDVAIEGTVLVQQNGEARTTGRLTLLRGKVELQGRTFQIERGYVTFTGPDPSNPQVVATAFWDAPDGTRVFAELSGNVEDAKLDLRSEPALTEDQIVSLIAFGTSDGGVGASTSTAGAGAGLAGGVLTQGFNELISGAAPAISTRVETSESGNPKPGVAIQISSKVSASVGYAVGAPSPGDSPDRATVTLDWRFYRNWSIAAEVGDRGSTSVDVVWRMRY